jgi:hypothetical protein
MASIHLSTFEARSADDLEKVFGPRPTDRNIQNLRKISERHAPRS